MTSGMTSGMVGSLQTRGVEARSAGAAAHLKPAHAANDASGFGGADDAAHAQLVTVFIGGQVFGMPILQVRDVFLVSGLTPVPLAPASVAGLYNLRGRVMTMLSMRALLGFERCDASGSETTAIGIEWGGESFGLLVDKVGEVMTLAISDRERVPIHLSRSWAALSAGVHRLEDRLLIELNLESLFRDATFQNAAGDDPDGRPTSSQAA